MSESFNIHLLSVLKLTREMLDLAEKGDNTRPDRSCGILFGTLRDSAFKLNELAEREIEHHKKVGTWDVDLISSNAN